MDLTWNEWKQESAFIRLKFLIFSMTVVTLLSQALLRSHNSCLNNSAVPPLKSAFLTRTVQNQSLDSIQTYFPQQPHDKIMLTVLVDSRKVYQERTFHRQDYLHDFI